MKRIVITLVLAIQFSAAALSQAQTPTLAQNAGKDPAKDLIKDPFKALSFLEQSWEANTNGYGGVKSTGTYTFHRELSGHILSRRSTSDSACKGPAGFDCEHGDMLYVYPDGPGMQLKAIYFDNEGHVIHYDVSTPAPMSVVFLSEGAGGGPQFRLTYELKDTLLVGKFQSRMPGQSEWNSYLEWSGGKK